MKHSKFKELVLNNMPANNNPGLWQNKGLPKNHILGNPKSPEDKEDLINKCSLLENVPPIDCKNIHLHQYAHHLNSSQIMCYNFFRPLMEDINKPSIKLIKLIEKEINQKMIICNASCEFEHIDKNERTNFDFYLKIGDIEVYFEIKYTEECFSKSSAKDPHKQYEKTYKPLIAEAKDIFIGGTIKEEDFNKYYQLARNAIRATNSNKHVFFICPKENEGLIEQFNSFAKECLTDYGKSLIRLITWEKLLEDAKELGIDVTAFDKRYLAFLR